MGCIPTKFSIELFSKFYLKSTGNVVNGNQIFFGKWLSIWWIKKALIPCVSSFFDYFSDFFSSNHLGDISLLISQENYSLVELSFVYNVSALLS
jgi:hypothetical protein